MNMVVDMIDAEAVIAGTAGAVTEFQIGIVCVRPSAYGAFMMIELLPFLLPDSLRFPAEVDGLFARLLWEISQKRAREENRKDKEHSLYLGDISEAEGVPESDGRLGLFLLRPWL